MTTTNLNGIITTVSGKYFHLEGEPTDAAAASELNVRDVAGTSQSVKDALRGETITRIQLQACDGSILTSMGVQKNGSYVVFVYGGERIASSPSVANIDVWDLAIAVDDTTKIMVVVDE